MTHQLVLDIPKDAIFSEDSTEASIKGKQGTGQAINRPIHYLGSKLRMLSDIEQAIHTITQNPSTICDLFAGSGTVSNHFKNKSNVISVDIQAYSKIICSALLTPKELDTPIDLIDRAGSSKLLRQLEISVQPLIQWEEHVIKEAQEGNPYLLCEMLECGSIIGFDSSNPDFLENSELKLRLSSVLKNLEKENLLYNEDSLITRYFGGVYFSYLQTIYLDCLLSEANSLSIELVDLYTAAILSTASDAVNTVGKHFAQPIRPRDSSGQPKKGLWKQVSKDRDADIFALYDKWIDRYHHELSNSSGFHHKAIQSDYSEFLENTTDQIDIFYADPPYTRDHYSRFYHVLETMCLRDNPSVSSVKINGTTMSSRGIYRENRHQSPFCIKTQAPLAFETLFQGVARKNAPLVLSYSPFNSAKNNRPRLLSIEDIVTIGKRYFSDIEVETVEAFTHSKLNSAKNNYETLNGAEVLLLCRP